jgi:glutamate/tyrosine decarboxylase-like PLP-dependent enzyme
MGYDAVDRIVDAFAKPAHPFAMVRPSADAPAFAPAPESGTPLDELLRMFERDVLAGYARPDHPRYFAFIPGSTTWPSSLGDLIAAATNIQVDSWFESPGPTRLETTVIDWMKDWVGYPAEAAGILLSGGSAANMTALACCRETRIGPMADDLMAYVADQSHSSLARAARILGFRPTQVRVLPTDTHFRLRPETLAAAIDADRAAGKRPLFASVSAGATNTGMVDPLRELAAVCHERDVWLHVDGAYGAFAVLTDEGRTQLDGLAEADSITVDPHKWLYQPFEVGGLLVRDGSALRKAFEIVPDYLADTEAAAGEVNYSDMGMQLTRYSRALKVWLSVRFFGLAAFRTAIQHSMDLAKYAEERIDASSALELTSAASLGIVCFRRAVQDADEAVVERVNRRLASELEESGEAFVSSTRLHGRYTLRLCVLNHTSTKADVDFVLDHFEHGQPTDEAVPEASYDRQPDVRSGWPGGLTASGPWLGTLRLFRSVDPARLDALAAAATPRTIPAGSAVVEQWESGDDFFVLTRGSVRVLVNGEEIRVLRAGEYFGELAALEWGASFRYPRLATVVAAE